MDDTTTPGTDAGATPGTTPGTENSFKAPESQEALDTLIAKATAKVHKRYEGHDDFKAKATQFDALQSGQADELSTVKKTNEELTAKLEKRDNRLILAAANAAAAELKSTLSAEHLLTLAGTDGVTVGDDGQVTGIKERFAPFLEANPQYVGSDTPGQTPAALPLGLFDGGASGSVKTDLVSQIAEAESRGDRAGARRLKTQLLVKS